MKKNKEKNQLYFTKFVPTMLSLLAFGFGISAIKYSYSGHIMLATSLLLIACFLDGIDGRIARFLKVSSDFGAQMDSLADLVNFGVAPGFILYCWKLNEMQLGFLSWFAVLLLACCMAIRLARFNISTANSEPGVFIGLPIPSAAAIVVLWILIDLKYHFLSEFQISWALLILGFVAGILMVSNIRYPSFKKLKWNLKIFVIAVMILAAVYIAPREVFGILMSGYVLWGIARWLFVVFVKILFKKTA